MSTVPFIFAGDTGNIPLSQLDDNFANVKLSVDYVIQNTQANINTVGTLTALSVTGNIAGNTQLIIAGNITSGGNLLVTKDANIVANLVTGNLRSFGTISAGGSITGANISGLNIVASATISATGNITGGNFFTSGIVSAVSNVYAVTVVANAVQTGLLTSADVSLSGNLVVFGNATIQGNTTFIDSQTLNVNDKNITVANNVSTSVLIDGAGIDAGNPTVAYIRYSDVSKGWTTANNFSVGSNLTVTGTSALTGVVTAPTAANTVANTQVATTAFVRNIIPAGVITMWYGSIASIPDGWYLCNGTNGTPDLRDRFIVGAGNIYSVNGTGGSANAVLVSHTHTANSVVTDPGHRHVITSGQVNTRTNPYFNWTGTGGASVGIDGAGTDNANTGVTVATTNSTEGVSATNANLPPYYALAYIMKA